MSSERIPNLPVHLGAGSPEHIVEREQITGDWWVFRFTVVGKGDFPLDMLRHDHCFPADTTSALNIAHPSERGEPEKRHEVREITLSSHWPRKLWLPTFGRWASFGWHVKSTAWEG